MRRDEERIGVAPNFQRRKTSSLLLVVLSSFPRYVSCAAYCNSTPPCLSCLFLSRLPGFSFCASDPLACSLAFERDWKFVNLIIALT